MLGAERPNACTRPYRHLRVPQAPVLDADQRAVVAPPAGGGLIVHRGRVERGFLTHGTLGVALLAAAHAGLDGVEGAVLFLVFGGGGERG